MTSNKSVLGLYKISAAHLPLTSRVAFLFHDAPTAFKSQLQAKHLSTHVDVAHAERGL